MTGLFLPAVLTALALITAGFTYRNIRRGGARFYTLEREAILRQASLTLLISSLFFLGAVGLLIFQQQATTGAAPGDDDVLEGEPTATPESQQIDTFPPTAEPTATPDLTLPTPTATVAICRGVVEGTAGNGLTLRDAPGGGDVTVLQDGSILTVFDDPPQEVNGFTWVRVRSVFGDEGWVADQFVTLGVGCNQNAISP